MASSFRRRTARPPQGSAEPPASSSSESPSSAPSSQSTSSSSALLSLRGTKPWTFGASLTSTGLPDLDAILGGGQPLGTALYVSRDDRTGSALASCLVRCWCAEALSQGHHLLIPVLGDDEESPHNPSHPSPWIEEDEKGSRSCNRSSVLELLRSLPRNRLFPRKQGSAKAPTNPDTGGTDALETLVEGREGGNEGDGDDDADGEEDDEETRTATAEENLKIAWQYSTSHQQRMGGIVPGGQARERGSGSRATSGRGGDGVFCHPYDLSARWTDSATGPTGGPGGEPETLAALEPIALGSGAAAGRGLDAGYSFFLQLCELVRAGCHSDAPSSPRRVVRLLLYLEDDEGESDGATGALSVALPLLLSHIRAEALPVVTLVTVPASLACGRSQSKSMRMLQRTCDAVLEVENFASRKSYPPPAEFRHLQGLLKVHKVSTHTCSSAVGTSGGGVGPGHFADWTVTKRPAAFLYGLKRDRRTMSIPMLHIPPEDYAEGGGSVGSGGVRSGAGRSLGCSSTGGGAGGTDSPLDF